MRFLGTMIQAQDKTAVFHVLWWNTSKWKGWSVIGIQQAFGGSGGRWEKSNITVPKELIL